MPLSLIPTFAVMQLMGFSLNVITLLALTLVIGILVDDAIVEIENIQKRIEAGQTPYRAAMVGADSIGLAVVATTLTIVAVFLPVSFMPGIPGQFFKEFGLTVSVAVLFSLLAARFATPPLAAYFLKPSKHPEPKKPLGGFYRAGLDWALTTSGSGGPRRPGLLLLHLSGGLPAHRVPARRGFRLLLPADGGPARGHPRAMSRAVAQATDAPLASSRMWPACSPRPARPAGGSAFGGSGGSDLRDGTITVVLKDRRRPHHRWRQEPDPAHACATIPDVRINTQGSFGAADVNIILGSDNPANLDKAELELEKEMRASAHRLRRAALAPAARPRAGDPAQGRGGRPPRRQRPDPGPPSCASPPSATSTPTWPNIPRASAASPSACAWRRTPAPTSAP